jgi:dienelactone hydrolase
MGGRECRSGIQGASDLLQVRLKKGKHMFRPLRMVLVFCALSAQLIAAPGLQSIDPIAYDALAGNYQLGNGSALGINLFPTDDGKPGLLYTNYQSGVVRRLFPMGGDVYGAGPGFALPSPVELTIRFIKDERGAIQGIGLQPVSGPEEIAERVAVRAREVTFQGNEATLAGTLLTPPTPGPHPAIILLHGSGRLTRWSFGPYPRFFASLGLAVLVYDKRATGNSTGTYAPPDTSYPAVLVGDAIAAVRSLQANDDIDGSRIGLWGSSEGGMLATQVAARLDGIAFVINSSGFMMPLWEQMLYNIEAQLRAEGFSPAEVADALNYRKLNMAVARTGDGWDEFVRIQAAARKQPWWSAYFGPSEGISSLESARRLWTRTYSFDPLPALKSVRSPVLGLFGSLDTATPARLAAANMQRALNDGGNRNVTVRIFESANHPLMEAQTGSNAEIPRLQRMVPGLFDLLRSWIAEQIKRN